MRSELDETTEQELSRRAIDGDRAAQERLWGLHRGWIAAVLAAHRPRGVEVEDLLQDVALRFVQNARSIEAPGALRGWLRTVAVHTARSSGRKQSVRQRVPVQGGEAAFGLLDARHEARCGADERLEEVEAALRGLPADQQEVLRLRSVHGFSQRELARVLGCREEAVESRLSRARRGLRQALEHRAPEVLPFRRRTGSGPKE